MEGQTVGIIGAGAAGLAAAIAAGQCGDRVILLEKFPQAGKKISAAGNGRCNLMNLRRPIYYGDPEFAASVLGDNPAEDMISFWRDLGLPIRFDPEGRGYPCTFMASTVMDVLKAEMRRLQTDLRLGAGVSDVKPAGDGFLITLNEGADLRVDRVIITTGGAAQPKLGGNRSAWPWLERMGHPMVPAKASLVPLKAEKKALSGLSGLRVRCGVTLETEHGAVLHQEQGEMLFTEEGISGICIMQCARFLPEGEKVLIRADFIQELFHSRDALIQSLMERAGRFPEEEPTALIRGLCAGKLAYAVCKQAGLPMRGERICQLKAEQIRRVADVLRGYRIPITGTEGLERAQVTAGGADCRFFQPENMESRIQPGLHAAGEILNVDGDCGGYNLMFAFLSGRLAGANGRRERNI